MRGWKAAQGSPPLLPSAGSAIDLREGDDWPGAPERLIKLSAAERSDNFINQSRKALNSPFPHVSGLGEGTTDAGPTSQRLDSVRGIIERGKPYTFRHRAVEAYLASDWPEVD